MYYKYKMKNCSLYIIIILTAADQTTKNHKKVILP